MAEVSKTDSSHRWWKEGVCYQVWPLSFKDSNADGEGDIRGLISKLDYLKDLGVDYIWLSPMYASPLDDYGYDISNYEDVNPKFGTLQDMDDLIAGLKQRGMRLILDLIVNHTSTQHHWFQESMKSKDNEYSDFYIWKDPKIVDGKRHPPNNWRCLMDPDSAWEYVESRNQYYLHLFLKSMPDLNWPEAKVRKTIFDSAVAFWLARGVSGFRIDVVNIYEKNPTFPDLPVVEPTEPYQQITGEMVVNGPHMHGWLLEQRNRIREQFGDDIVLVGEAGASPPDEVKRYISPPNREMDMIFDFDIFHAGGPQHPAPWIEWTDDRGLPALRKALIKPQSYISDLQCWATTFLENHDQPRSVSKFGSRKEELQIPSAKLLALIIASMSGTVFLYQGQEIGMTNTPTTWKKEDFRDPYWLSFLTHAIDTYPDPSDPKHQKGSDIFYRNNRDNARTPMQWSAEEPYGGFTTVKPWFDVNDNFKRGVNVEEQLKDPNSVLAFWCKVLQFRKANLETMVYAHTKFIDNENPHIFSFIKHQPDQGENGKRVLVVLNYSDDAREFPTLDQSELEGSVGPYWFGTGPSSDTSKLGPWEGRVFVLEKA